MECQKPTAELKPYCLEHIDRLPHARHVIEELARREREITLARSGRLALNRKLDPNRSTVLKDIRTRLLCDGPCSIGQLARWFNHDNKVASQFVAWAKRYRLVEVKKQRKSRQIVRWIGE